MIIISYVVVSGRVLDMDMRENYRHDCWSVSVVNEE